MWHLVKASLWLLSLLCWLVVSGNVLADDDNHNNDNNNNNYTFPGNLPSGCSGSNGIYTCNSLSLSNLQTITVSNPVPATITINGNLTTNNNNGINASGSTANLNLIVTGTVSLGYLTTINANIVAGAINDSGSSDNTLGGNLTTTTGNITLGYQTTVAGSITTTSGSISLGQNGSSGAITSSSGSVDTAYQAQVKGNITTNANITLTQATTVNGNISAGSGNINIGYQGQVAGNISASGSITIAQASVINGNITGSVGAVSLGYQVIVNGAILTSSGQVSIAQADVISGCVTTTSANISLGYWSAIGGACCGANCSTSCVTGYNNNVQQCPTSSIQPVASYHLDEAAWTGASGEVIDSTGNGYNGKAIGNPLANTSNTSPAISGSPGSCAYGGFSGGTSQQGANMGTIDLGLGSNSSCGYDQFWSWNCNNYNNFFNNTFYSIFGDDDDNNQQGQYDSMSVSAWVKWTINPASGNNWANIVSNNSASASDKGQFWLQHSQNNTTFEFAVATDNARSYIESKTTPVLNQWYHVVGVYDGAQLAIYVNGNLENTTNLSGNIVAYNNFRLSIGQWAYNSQNYRAFQGNVDEVQIFSNAITATQVKSLYTQTHTCPSYSSGVGSVPSGFNCVEVGATGGDLNTKLAANAFSLDVLALASNGSVNTSYVGTSNKNVTLELVNGAGSTACASRTSLSSAYNQTVAFTSANKGRKTVTIGATNYAYPDVRCRITDANQTPSVVACSSDDFVIRPQSLTVTASTLGADSTGVSATATPVNKAGSSFSLTATSDVPGYTGTPTINNSLLLAQTGATQVGALTGSFNAATASTGAATNSNFSYSDVGYFGFATDGVYDSTFAQVDIANGDCSTGFSNTLTAGQYGCSFGNSSQSNYFGRFIPDHFLATVNSNGNFAHSCSSFSYNGQTLYYANGSHPVLNVVPYNTSGVVTKNYTGTFNRLLASQFSLTTPTSDALQKGADNATLVKLSANMATPTLTDNGGGSLSLMLGNDSFTYQRESNALISAFSNSIAIPITNIKDSDGVLATNLPVSLQPAGENIRYGRVSLLNANGSELSDLAITMLTEYYNAGSFITNTADTCSVATVTITDPLTSDSLTPSNTCIWDTNHLSGSLYCPTTAPTGESYLEGNLLASGSFNLYLKAPGVTGPLNVNASVASWLQYNWTGSGNTNPSALATFGLYKGNTKQIFFKENY